VAEVERVLEARVGVEAREKDVGPAVEEALRPVAVVVVDVEEGDARAAAEEQRLGGDGGIVQEAVAPP